ncbi:iron ABC transporter permease [Rhizobium sp. 2MFCol3.1]|uniref:FecCD family ABC transporter permease n=1 Tax=Rhizobium sp. 2MFCol3.1 TaxID=1246459 RepID=UPI00055DA6B9|nr:iron ABC transporter permease [Rhizobium sp. 2MFCol3.1]
MNDIAVAANVRAGSAPKVIAILAAAVALLTALAVIHIGVGARFIGPRTVLSAMTAYDARNLDHKIIVDLRLLRLLSGICTGTALGLAGALLQSIVRNSLGEPHILGLNAGAALAVVLTTALGGAAVVGPLGRPLVAAIGAAVVFGLVISMASSGKTGLTPIKATLCGIAFSAFASSFTGAILILDEQTLMDLRIWLAGDLAGLTYPALDYAAMVAAVGIVAAVFLAPYLNVLALGDNVARGLGVKVTAVRAGGLVCAALLSGAAVSIAGPVGFVGLVVPHVARRFAGNDLRLLLPLSAIGGAALLLASDIVARMVVAPQELATGVVTAIVGAPVFILIAARSYR